MEGRRSTDRNFWFGYPSQLNPNKLPTESDIVSHSLFLKREKVASKEWRNNTPVGDIATKVADDVIVVWDKTDIPHYGRKTVKEKIEKLLVKSKGILKIPHERRNNIQLSEIWGSLLDISVCPHRSKNICECPDCWVLHPEFCVCPPDIRVPDSWKAFLWDQRGGRDTYLSTVDWQKVREERDILEKLMTDMKWKNRRLKREKFVNRLLTAN